MAIGLAPQGFTPTRVMLCAVDKKITKMSAGDMQYTVRQQAGAYTPELGTALALPNTGLSDPSAT